MIRSTARRPRVILWHALSLLALFSALVPSSARAATDLTVTITDTRATASPGDTLSFFITVANTSASAIPNATVTVSLPTDVTYLASSGGTPAGQDVAWTGQSLAPGNSSFFVAATVGGAVADGTVLTTTATATYGVQTPSTGSDTTRVARPVVQFTPASIAAFGNQLVGSTSTAKTVLLKNIGSADLVISSFVISGDFAFTQDCPNALAPNQTCQISVTFTPTATGARTGALTLTDNAANSPQTLNLSGTGTQPTLAVSTLDLQFGTVLVNTTKTATVELRNTGTATLNIASISTPVAPFSRTNCAATLAPNARCTITVTFAPTASGSFSSNFVVTTDGGNATVALAGSGISPGSALSATTLD
ncbi:MAG: choice-of-anchor D domain-containing protein, partial [Roseiflexaceae bacterium]|nr:choice-of-anchor D domain-containing protein [Roseiflexaceae bacterium]